MRFQSSRSLRTATGHIVRLSAPDNDFNPRGPCGPRLTALINAENCAENFNPRGPCGPRPTLHPRRMRPPTFQSSRSLRTATPGRAPCCPAPRYFNPRGPCGPRRECPGGTGDCRRISILAVLADRDDGTSRKGLRKNETFQSSRSLRTATAAVVPVLR